MYLYVYLDWGMVTATVASAHKVPVMEVYICPWGVCGGRIY